MSELKLNVTMLGEFSIQCDESRISDGDNRSRKLWLLLAYLICSRKRAVTADELSHLLWSEGQSSANPASALKTTLHRARSYLDQLSPGAGHLLITYRAGAYLWNPEIPLTLDVEEFESLCKADGESEESLSQWRRALDLYRGEFLEKLSSAPWVVPVAAYYRSLYIQTVLKAIRLLERDARWEELCQLCRKALRMEPDNETVCQSLMRALYRLGRVREAIQVYDTVSERLMSGLGIIPSDETRALYRELVRIGYHGAISIDALRERLREADDTHGGMVCDYDFFRILYQSTARLMERSGSVAHLALISVRSRSQKELSRQNLEQIMENLLKVTRSSLRRGDVISQCSASQYALLLPGANEENSRMICERIMKRFYQQYPYTPARCQADVQPVEVRSGRL